MNGNLRNKLVLKTTVIIIILLFPIKVFCQTEFDSLNIVEGTGTNIFFIGETRKLLKTKVGRGDKCEGWQGEIKRNETNGSYIDSRSKKKKIWKNFYCYDSLGVTVLLKKGRVNFITFKSLRLKTLKGISIGSTRQEVLKVYGGDFDSPRIVYWKSGVAFIFEDDKVKEIQVFKSQL